MVDPDKTVQAFKESFCKKSPAEQEEYLKRMGFSFENSPKERLVHSQGRVSFHSSSVLVNAGLPVRTRRSKIRKRKTVGRVNVQNK